jgi:hypothetical protein
MVKSNTLKEKQTMLSGLVDQIKDVKKNVLPILKLFRRVVKDQKEKQQTTYYSNNYNYAGYQPSGTSQTYINTNSSTGAVMTSYSFKLKDDNEESIYNTASSGNTTVSTVSGAAQPTEDKKEDKEKDPTIKDVLN